MGSIEVHDGPELGQLQDRDGRVYILPGWTPTPASLLVTSLSPQTPGWWADWAGRLWREVADTAPPAPSFLGADDVSVAVSIASVAAHALLALHGEEDEEEGLSAPGAVVADVVPAGPSFTVVLADGRRFVVTVEVAT